jgi:hypothetical protein
MISRTIKFRYTHGHPKVGAEMYTVGTALKTAWVGISTLGKEPNDTGTMKVHLKIRKL